MIDAREIERRAERLGLLPAQVEKDYLLNHLLAAISDASAPLAPPVFDPAGVESLNRQLSVLSPMTAN